MDHTSVTINKEGIHWVSRDTVASMACTDNTRVPFTEAPTVGAGTKRHNVNATHTQATALRSLHRIVPSVRSTDLRSLLPSPSACLLHYLKHSLVFMCRAGDVASSSTFPSRAVYIREPIWLYKTRQQKGGGPEARRGETWKPFYGAANCALDKPRTLHICAAECEGYFRFHISSVLSVD